MIVEEKYVEIISCKQALKLMWLGTWIYERAVLCLSFSLQAHPVTYCGEWGIKSHHFFLPLYWWFLFLKSQTCASVLLSTELVEGLFKGVAYRVFQGDWGKNLQNQTWRQEKRVLLNFFFFKFEHMIPPNSSLSSASIFFCKTALREGKTSPKLPVVLPPAAVDDGGREWGMVVVLRKKGAGFLSSVSTHKIRENQSS